MVGPQRVCLSLTHRRLRMRRNLFSTAFVVVSLIVIDHYGPVAPAFVLDHHGSGGAVVESEIAQSLHLPLLIGRGLEGVVCWGGGSFPLRC